MSRHHPLRSGGYVLLLTLVLLAMIAAGLAAVARRSAQASLDATRVERQIQKRWLHHSAENLLPYIDAILAHSDPTPTGVVSPQPPAQPDLPPQNVGQLSYTFDLGHHQATLVLADEQAKANLNVLWNRLGPETFNGRWPAWNTTMGLFATTHPRAMTPFEMAAAGLSHNDWPAFMAYEQLYGPENVIRFATTSQQDLFVSNPLDHFTLWGSGALRVERAGLPACQAILSPLLSDEQIMALRLDDGVEADLDLTDRQRRLLPERLAETSGAFSVRLTLDDGRRRSTHLVIHPELQPFPLPIKNSPGIVADTSQVETSPDQPLDRSQLIRFDW